MKLFAECHHLIINARARARVAHLRVDMIGKVEHCGSLGEFQQVALGCEHEHLVLIQVHLKLVHHLHVVACLEDIAYVVEPLVESALSLHSLVSPVGGHSPLGHFVHALCAYLHFHPFLLRSEHCDVQTLISVRLRHREPVAQSLRVGLIHVGYYRICLPALHLLQFERRVDDDTDGKQVVYSLEGAFLLLHLLPYRVNTLGAALHVELESRSLQFLSDGFDESRDILVARLFCGVEFFAYHIIYVVLEIFQRQVLKFTFQFIQSQLVCQRCIEICRLLTHLVSRLVVGVVLYLTHQSHTVGDHDKYHSHVLGERQEEIAEILAFHHRVLLVELAYAQQAVEYSRRRFAKLAPHLLYRHESVLHTRMQQYGQHCIALQSDFLNNNLCCL